MYSIRTAIYPVEPTWHIINEYKNIPQPFFIFITSTKFIWLKIYENIFKMINKTFWDIIYQYWYNNSLFVRLGREKLYTIDIFFSTKTKKSMTIKKFSNLKPKLDKLLTFYRICHTYMAQALIILLKATNVQFLMS